MNSSLDEILDSYSDDQINLVVDFLRRCTQAGHCSPTSSRRTRTSPRSGAAPQPALRAHFERSSVAALKRAEHQRAWQSGRRRSMPAPPSQPGRRWEYSAPTLWPPPETYAAMRQTTRRNLPGARVPPAPSLLLLPRLDRVEKWLVTPSHATPAAHRQICLATSSKNALHSAFALVSPDVRRNSLARQNDPICAPQAGDPHMATGRPERRISHVVRPASRHRL